MTLRLQSQQSLSQLEALATNSKQAAWVRCYYARAPSDAIAGRTVSNLYGAAIAHLGFSQRRNPGEMLVRIYNPTIASHGWESLRTVIEVVSDDLPFLVDSLCMAVYHHKLPVLEVFQALVGSRRDAVGDLVAILEPDAGDCPREALVHIELSHQADLQLLEQLQSGLKSVLADVSVAVQDWQPMRTALSQLQAELTVATLPVSTEEHQESLEFLAWLADHHFTFIGYCYYPLDSTGHPNTGLGILRHHNSQRILHLFAGISTTAEATPKLLLLTKASTHSTIHRAVVLDLVIIRHFNHAGQVVGEHRFLGLYGSRAYNCLPQDIPIVRRSIATVKKRANLDSNSHYARALQHILDTYPRDELLQIEAEDLYRISLGILELGERQRVRLFIRQDQYGRFLSCLVYIPRERYNTVNQQLIQQILKQVFNATAITFTVNLTEAPLAKVLFVVHVPETSLAYDAEDIEAQIATAIQSWRDELYLALLRHAGEARGQDLYQEFAEAFPAGYKEEYPANVAIQDIEQIRSLTTDGDLRLSLYNTTESKPGQLRFRVVHRNKPLPLHQAMQILENMAVRVEEEQPHKIQTVIPVWIHDFGLTCITTLVIDTDLRTKFQDAFASIWSGLMVNDELNSLVLLAGLEWRRVVLLRTYTRYLRQTALNFSQAYMEEALVTYPDITKLLVELFELRFDPARVPQAQARINRVTLAIQSALDGVHSLDHDRILRNFLAAIQATLRTNFYQKDLTTAKPKPRLALKLDSKRILDLPNPRPRYEIFVYTPRVEGIHLRGGLVARGGLRWSDRREDYRTEILGLMKAQMVKNTVIVPVGAKGGFIVKHPPLDANKETLYQEGVNCYRQFIAGLLDLTDNLTETGCHAPPDLIRYDSDDPYLVVAADKGTASFSDVANEVAVSYGFWLGDAFASGGRTGYDHKQMGITARSTWECIRQHFRILGINYEQQHFSVVGIGDMSGDVFGNGLLLSNNMRLLAAFDHRHIFLDPNPDPQLSYQERARLFALSNSSWADYNPALISPGGGVYARNLKSIVVSPAVSVALACDASRPLTPAELIRTILRAPVDLLWNGGIGTFVKASWQSHNDVMDRNNDVLRIDAPELRCRIIGEGGNLGLTQAARVEYAQLGGHLDTDFIHNLGGVNCSDREVNIKILLDRVVAEGNLTTEQRNQLLATMTSEVAALVLQDSYWQGCAIGLEEARGVWLLPEQARFIKYLEQNRHLDRILEYLPSEAELQHRQVKGQGLTRPELALLIAYAKHSIYEDLLASDLAEDTNLALELERYFPTPVREPFQTYIHRHRLRREILCTTVANRLVNRFGSTFVFRLQEELAVTTATVIRAGIVIWESFGLCRLWTATAALPTAFPETLRITILNRAGRLASIACRRLLQIHPEVLSTKLLIERYQKHITDLVSYLPHLPDLNLANITSPLLGAGAPPELALLAAETEVLGIALDLVLVAEQTQINIRDVAMVAFRLNAVLELEWLEQRITALPTQDRWSASAKTGLRDELLYHLRQLCVAILTGDLPGSSTAVRLEFWQHRYHLVLERYKLLITELRNREDPDMPMLWVTLRMLSEFTA